jgi:hypothetical protein
MPLQEAPMAAPVTQRDGVMPDLDLIKQEEQGAWDRRGRVAKGRSSDPAGKLRSSKNRTTGAWR